MDGYRFFKIVSSEGLFQKLSYETGACLQKAFLLLDNAPSHPSEGTLSLDNGHLPIVTSIIQPLNQGMN
jgi:hypothetical protein